MPELPEVETTKRGIAPHLIDQQIREVIVRNPRLRWPIPKQLSRDAKGQTITQISRRGKYLLLTTPAGTIILHLGMSGNLRVLPADTTPQKHDHLDLILSNGKCLRLHDPRRFGACLWSSDDPLNHPLLCHLGPEPWDADFNAQRLYDRSRQRKIAIKNFIMDSKTVVGVGNIYASEALFKSAIRPDAAAGKISKKRYQTLVIAIQQILTQAIDQGGTTLKDFLNSSGQPGYFQQELAVYGRKGETCRDCDQIIRSITLGQRSSYFCPHCQRR